MDWECLLSQCASLQAKCHSPLFWAGRIMKESIKSSNSDRKQTKIHVSLFWGSKRIRLLRQELFYKGLFMGRKKSLTDVYGQFNKAASKNLVCYLSDTTQFFRSALGSGTWNVILTLTWTGQEALNKSLWCLGLFLSFPIHPLCLLQLQTLQGCHDRHTFRSSWLMQPETHSGSLMESHRVRSVCSDGEPLSL